MKCILYTNICVFNFRGSPDPQKYFNNERFPNYGMALLYTPCESPFLPNIHHSTHNQLSFLRHQWGKGKGNQKYHSVKILKKASIGRNVDQRVLFVYSDCTVKSIVKVRC